MPKTETSATLDWLGTPGQSSAVSGGGRYGRKDTLSAHRAQDRIVAFIGSPLGLLAAWLVLINTVTFLIFGVDKLLAKHPRFRQRVPEKNLLLLAVVGGSVGALLGMYLFRHKTLHRVFRVGVPVILAVQLLLAAAIALYWNFLQ